MVLSAEGTEIHGDMRTISSLQGPGLGYEGCSSSKTWTAPGGI